MYQLTLDISEEIALAPASNPDRFRYEVLLAAAVKLYDLGTLSSGAAANLVGIPRTLFLTKLADYGVSTFQLGEAELLEDLTRA
jgi:predicted HTH domain antitoxin